jgi:tRNA pseudouridine32 synthase / 23S rRNA pseudouridine746 synthase
MSGDFLTGRLLYRDGLILVLDKPAGLPVHPGPKGGETLHDHLDSLRFGLPSLPQVAHRLDRDTSGCLVLGRHRQALARLNLLFRQGKIEKTYLALIEGAPETESGFIDLPLAPRSRERGWWQKPDPNGQEAKTRWQVLARHENKTLLALFPLTGRTHQLRVHCAAQGWPICGDRIYGPSRYLSPEIEPYGLHLHALRLVIPLHESKSALTVEAPPPNWAKAYQNMLIEISSTTK